MQSTVQRIAEGGSRFGTLELLVAGVPRPSRRFVELSSGQPLKRVRVRFQLNRIDCINYRFVHLVGATDGCIGARILLRFAHLHRSICSISVRSLQELPVKLRVSPLALLVRDSHADLHAEFIRSTGHSTVDAKLALAVLSSGRISRFAGIWHRANLPEISYPDLHGES
ncbi:hypothetical protein NU688_23190 [Variovorax sp. ZS18.2.2]|uniref:hypothetical protein n=1 Tax=Variovorax sp. ZS18.2.2 TaxID=2971255 RepID=UPI002150AFA8|nr:hypothetical protein [Variovorax sp. ZS18.2.2]MCR6479081.1 hypothetical protein [Variovorax sp. ZS18.2.2]